MKQQDMESGGVGGGEGWEMGSRIFELSCSKDEYFNVTPDLSFKLFAWVVSSWQT